jgi:ABC-type protease/lipase transport system fused ATPase/permease subunit
MDSDNDLNKKEKNIDDENKITLNDINQLKTRIKSIGITFNEMNTIQVYIYIVFIIVVFIFLVLRIF